MKTRYSAEELLKFTHRELVLHSVLLLRMVNKCHTKEEDIDEYSKLSDEDLADYIVHFYDPYEEPELEPYVDESMEMEFCEDDYYTPSCTAGDYSPSCPWNAPGMSIHDFI